jgi:hypothetical protein
MLIRVWRLFSAAQVLLATLISQVTAAHGTYLAAGGTADHIAVAIDNRITGDTKEGQTGFNDHYCKILPLSDSAIFFFTGIGSLIDHGVPVFDAQTTAQQVYQEDPLASFEDLAGRWALIMIGNYKTNNEKIFIRSSPLIEGFFAGSNTNGMLGIYGERILGPLTQPVAEPLNYDINNDNLFEMASSIDLLREFANGGTTDRAREALQILGLEARGKSQTISTALRFETMVDVAGQSGNPRIGGETAVMTMERGDHTWRWFHRPDYCPRG